MSDLVDAVIEHIVGAPRHPTDHLGRAVSSEQMVYILHSQECYESGVDLRLCDYSLALDRGIDVDQWTEDKPVLLQIKSGSLIGQVVPGE